MNEPGIAVTEQDRQFYQENGYWISPKLFNDDQIERLRKAHERIFLKDYDGAGFPLTELVLERQPDTAKEDRQCLVDQ